MVCSTSSLVGTDRQVQVPIVDLLDAGKKLDDLMFIRVLEPQQITIFVILHAEPNDVAQEVGGLKIQPILKTR